MKFITHHRPSVIGCVAAGGGATLGWVEGTVVGDAVSCSGALASASVLNRANGPRSPSYSINIPSHTCPAITSISRNEIPLKTVRLRGELRQQGQKQQQHQNRSAENDMQSLGALPACRICASE